MTRALAAHQLALPLPPLRRDWSRADTANLPPLDRTAPGLHHALLHHARAHEWSRHTRYQAVLLLRIAVSHLGLAEPFAEADLDAIANCHLRIRARRVFPFLTEHRMLTAGAPAPCRHERWVRRHVDQLPETVRGDVAVWVEALRGQGRRPSPPLAWVSVRNYLNLAWPALQAWAQRYEGLRQVDQRDVEDAIRDHNGRSAHNVHTALRSLFRGLKRERRIFADPARGITAHFARRLPRPLPLDRLRGLLDQITRPRDRLVTALVAVHALAIEELRALHLDDHDPVRGTLTVHRGGFAFTVTLDELVARLLADWLRTRSSTWPRTPNPHLLITRFTALTDEPISRYGLTSPFRTLGINARQLRADRILDEALHTADPVQLIRVFGLATTTAVRYVRVAHPEQFRPDPTIA